MGGWGGIEWPAESMRPEQRMSDGRPEMNGQQRHWGAFRWEVVDDGDGDGGHSDGGGGGGVGGGGVGGSAAVPNTLSRTHAGTHARTRKTAYP